MTTDTPTGTSKVGAAIAARREAGTGAVVGYLPVGFPDLDTSIDAAVTMAENGIDVIELGIPYSDPVMDGPVIQAATQRSLAEGFRVRDVFTAIREITARVDAPVIPMTYWNPVAQHGVQRFADDLAAAGGAVRHLERRYGDLGRTEIRRQAVGDALGLLESVLAPTS